jgi:Holliday junction resolvase
MAKYEIKASISYPSELAFQVDVENRLRSTGYRVFSIRDSRRVTLAGWPDIIAWKDQRMLALELKMPKNKLTAEQIVILEELKRVGVEVYVLYPSDLEFLKSLITEEPNGDEVKSEDPGNNGDPDRSSINQ